MRGLRPATTCRKPKLGQHLRRTAALRQERGAARLGTYYIAILGSGEVVRTLLAKTLIDQFILLIHPIMLGSEQRLFDDGGPGALFELADTQTTKTGVIAGTYGRTDRGPKGHAS